MTPCVPNTETSLPPHHLFQASPLRSTRHVLFDDPSLVLTEANASCRWSVGSGLFLASFAAVMGPKNYVYHLLSPPRLPFTTAYFGSIALTLVFAIKVCRTRFLATEGLLRANHLPAAKYYSHPDRRLDPDRLLAVVPRELLPDGLHRSSSGYDVWRKAGQRVDVRLRGLGQEPLASEITLIDIQKHGHIQNV